MLENNPRALFSHTVLAFNEQNLVVNSISVAVFAVYMLPASRNFAVVWTSAKSQLIVGLAFHVIGSGRQRTLKLGGSHLGTNDATSEQKANITAQRTSNLYAFEIDMSVSTQPQRSNHVTKRAIHGRLH